MEIHDIEAAIEGILFASGEAVSIERIAAVLAVETETVAEIAEALSSRLAFERRGVRLVRLEDKLQLCSAPEYGDVIRAALETRKPPRLTQTALEVLSIVAYFQPVTRAYIDKVRGIDSSYTVGVLAERGLIEPCGTLDAPGRPTLFRTTDGFLRTFGISSLEELPELKTGSGEGDGQIKIDDAPAAETSAPDAGDDGDAVTL